MAGNARKFGIRTRRDKPHLLPRIRGKVNTAGLEDKKAFLAATNSVKPATAAQEATATAMASALAGLAALQAATWEDVAACVEGDDESDGGQQGSVDDR